MTEKFSKVPRPGGGYNIIRDPNGVERWRLNDKWGIKPGRKPQAETRQRVDIRLPAEMVDWLSARGITETIERLVKREMENA